MTDPILVGIAAARDAAGLDAGAITVATLMANGLSRFEAEKAVGQLAAFLRRKKTPETPEESIARMLKSRVDGSDAADVVPALMLAGRVASAVGSRLLTRAAAKKAAALLASEAAWEAGMYGAGRQIARHRRLGTGAGPGRGYGRAAHRRRSRRDVADIDDGPAWRGLVAAFREMRLPGIPTREEGRAIAKRLNEAKKRDLKKPGGARRWGQSLVPKGYASSLRTPIEREVTRRYIPHLEPQYNYSPLLKALKF